MTLALKHSASDYVLRDLLLQALEGLGVHDVHLVVVHGQPRQLGRVSTAPPRTAYLVTAVEGAGGDRTNVVLVEIEVF